MATDSAEHNLVIKMPLFSKARPRMTRSGHTYMASSYREAQAEMRKQISEQWDRPPLDGPLTVSMDVYGEGRGDLDNIAGAFMDSGHNILWNDDRVSVISELSIKWTKAKKADSLWLIKIEQYHD